MRHPEREISTAEEIFETLAACDTLRVAMNDGEYPYLVPVSFGCELAGGRIRVYFHGAREGKKQDLLARNGKVCVEADVFGGYRATEHGVTCDYQSVIGFGEARLLEGEEAVHGLELLLRHCGQPEDSARPCAALGVTRVYEIELTSVTGKRRFR